MRNEPASGSGWTVRIEETLPERWGADVDAVAAALVRTATRAVAGAGKQPSVIRLRLGERVGFTDMELVTRLRRLSRGGPLSHARLVIERIPERWFCPGCDHNLHGKACRSCGLPGVLEAGEERILDSIEG